MFFEISGISQVESGSTFFYKRPYDYGPAVLFYRYININTDTYTHHSGWAQLCRI